VLVAGLSMVRVHNVWVADWRIIITLAGWFSVFGGVVRMLMPDKEAELGLQWSVVADVQPSPDTLDGLLGFAAMVPICARHFVRGRPMK
jgi:hypothetical protein